MTPKYEAPVDPNLQAQQAAAEQAKGDALQLRLKADTADIMTRFGARTALSGGGASQVMSSASPAGLLGPARSLPGFF